MDIYNDRQRIRKEKRRIKESTEKSLTIVRRKRKNQKNNCLTIDLLSVDILETVYLLFWQLFSVFVADGRE